MKLPKDIVGKNKLRDLHICTLYCAGKSAKEINDECYPGLSLTRIFRILNVNAGFINTRIAWPKSKRIHLLQRVAAESGTEINKRKDILDVLSELRKEIEGDKTQGSVIQNYIIIRNPDALKEEMEIKGAFNRIQM